MPSKSQATQLPTFGAFKKYITRKQNRLPSSTENSYREEESDCRVFLKTCAEPASQLSHGIKYLIFQKIIYSSKFVQHHVWNFCIWEICWSCETSEMHHGNFFASIHAASLVLMETQNIPMIMRELPVRSGTRSWHLKTICCTSADSCPILGKLIWWEWGTMKSDFVAIPMFRWNDFIGSP